MKLFSAAALLAATLALPAAAQDAPAPELIPDRVLGNADAPVTLIEYASFTCPHCGHFHEANWDKLKTEYVDTGKVKFIHREVYFDKFGLWAGTVAQCGGDMKYYPIASMIYATQKDWIGDGQDATVANGLKKIGLKAGLTDAQVTACMSDTKLMERMVATFQKTSGDDQIDSTPTLVINGEKYSNMGWDELKKTIDSKLGG